MKKLFAILALMIVFAACRKKQHIPDNSDISMSRLQQQLNQQVTSELAGLIDYDKAILTKLRQDSIKILRLPFKNKSIVNKFILLKIGEGAAIETGRIVTIHKAQDTLMHNSATNVSKEGISSAGVFNGRLVIQNLDESTLLSAPIENGYIIKRDHKPLNRSQDLAIHIIPEPTPKYMTLPVIIIMAGTKGNGFSYSDWYNLEMMLSRNTFYNNGGNSGYYSSAEGNYDGGSGYSSGNGPALSGYIDQPMTVDFEGNNLIKIDLDSYLKCFDKIPDAGAVCSIELLTDLPVDNEPLGGFNTRTGSPGHTFLQIRKQNGDQSILQNIGFYPATALKTLMTTAPIPGIFANDARHEFNASIKMNLSADQLKRTLSLMSTLSKRIQYDIDDYNCTDFALEIFNFNRPANAIEIPKIEIPGTTTNNSFGSNTPQGLYIKLAEMKAGSGEASDISIPNEKGYVANSTGSCN